MAAQPGRTPDSLAEWGRTARLADGRRIGYAEVGAAAGAPVIYCHGFPASRLESRLLARAALERKVHLVAPDRPGYGLSDWKADRTIAGWADDVVELADHLNIPRFSVLGVSGGGPYALALAHGLPERVESVAVVCGLGPVFRPEAARAMPWPARFGFESTRRAPWLAGLVYGRLWGGLLRRRPDAALKLFARGLAEVDRRTLARAEIRSMIVGSLREGLRPGVRGALLDLFLYARNWAFDLSEIAVPIRFWHGGADATVPAWHTHLSAAGIPGAVVRILPGEGHFSLPVNHAETILENLLNRSNGGV